MIKDKLYQKMRDLIDLEEKYVFHEFLRAWAEMLIFLEKLEDIKKEMKGKLKDKEVDGIGIGERLGAYKGLIKDIRAREEGLVRQYECSRQFWPLDDLEAEYLGSLRKVRDLEKGLKWGRYEENLLPILMEERELYKQREKAYLEFLEELDRYFLNLISNISMLRTIIETRRTNDDLNRDYKLYRKIAEILRHEMRKKGRRYPSGYKIGNRFKY